MKTIKQIEQKVKRLQSRLRGCLVYENFGEKQVKELEDFIGDIYEYSYEERKYINIIVREFSNWCCNHHTTYINIPMYD